MIGKNSVRRTLVRIALTLGAMILLTSGGAVFLYPASAAIACPACYGFEALAKNVFVEQSMSLEQREHAQDVIAEARDRLGRFYGQPAEGNPLLFLCASAHCYRKFGGGSRGMALLDMALFLSPQGFDPVIAAHELSHIELHSRLGIVKTLRREIPQWFDEGVAVVVSDDPRYLASADAVDRCLVAPDGDLPVSRSAWIQNALNDRLYAKAACRVSRWIAVRGGAAAVISLIDQVAQGTNFENAYR